MYSFAPICCVSGGCVPSVVNTSVFRFAGRCASRTLEKFLASDRRPDLRSSAELISRCRGSNPAASTSQSVSNASHMKVAQKPRGTARFRMSGSPLRSLAMEVSFRAAVSGGHFRCLVFTYCAGKPTAKRKAQLLTTRFY